MTIFGRQTTRAARVDMGRVADDELVRSKARLLPPQAAADKPLLLFLTIPAGTVVVGSVLGIPRQGAVWQQCFHCRQPHKPLYVLLPDPLSLPLYGAQKVPSR